MTRKHARRRKPAQSRSKRSTGKKTGRPRKELDLKILQKLCELQCTDEELAAFFDVCINTVYDRKKDPEFLEVYKKGKALGKLSLRRTLWLHAQRHAGTAIFLSKNLLGSDYHHVQTMHYLNYKRHFESRLQQILDQS